MKLAKCVSIARQFQRSVRVDTDIGKDEALKGYVCQGSARHALELIARQFREAGQRAFTWTGPFGGGKSSLAVVLATYLAGNNKQRKQAADLLGKDATGLLHKCLGLTSEPWLVVPLVGHKADLVQDIRRALELHGPNSIKRRLAGARSNRDLVNLLVKLSEERPKSGVLILFDELGKFLEHAASTDGDIHFLQDLAEAAGRTQGRVIIIGVLHQTFEQYAVRLGHAHRDEWAKIQGRFTDISLIAALDEVVDLTRRAIVSSCKHPWSRALADVVASSVRSRRKSAPSDLADRLDDCWPLHPATAALLGPASKRRFGQNERSTFGFLSSAEPVGFRDFLETTEVESRSIYEPSSYWDYLRANLEPAILASPDGHRWSLAVDAIERCEAKGTVEHVKLIKSIAVLDLFRNGSGISAERDILGSCLPTTPSKALDGLLSDLERWSIAVHRKHLNSWTVFSGSDFDIESAVRNALSRGVDLKLTELSDLAGLSPILAKRLYHETGALRWFHTELCNSGGVEKRLSEFNSMDGAAGVFLLVIPTYQEPHQAVRTLCKEISGRRKEYPYAIGVPDNAEAIIEYGSELVALQTVKRERPELDGDPVARRELAARIGDVSARLEEQLRSALTSAQWYVGGGLARLDSSTGVVGLASRLASSAFPHTVVIHSELVNRHRPSSNTQAAVRQLLWAMAKGWRLERLGLEGFSAERGLFATTLEATKLHGLVDGIYSFVAPRAGVHQLALVELWKSADRIVNGRTSVTPMGEIYEEWVMPPFGVRRGLLPILALAYVLSNLSRVAVYRQGVYQSEFNEILADVLLQDPNLLGIRIVDGDDQSSEIIQAYALAIQSALKKEVATDPLAISRALVGFAVSLSPWARRTTALSNHSQGIRRLLVDASDPQKLLFVDIPMMFGLNDPGLLRERLEEALLELDTAYERMLRGVRDKMLSALNAREGDWPDLSRRAAVVAGAAGNLRLDAFAVRLGTFTGEMDQLEGIVSMAVNRPPRDWSDRDPDAATMELASLSLKFRQAEVLAAVKGRTPTRQAIALVIGTGETGHAAHAAFDVADSDHAKVAKLAGAVLSILNSTGLPKNLLLASIAEAGGELIARPEVTSSGD